MEAKTTGEYLYMIDSPTQGMKSVITGFEDGTIPLNSLFLFDFPKEYEDAVRFVLAKANAHTDKEG